MKKPPHDRRPDAFTLIELLTVIAIIGILAAILIPTVSAVREAARKAQCSSNIHQIATAMLMYANEHRGYFPAAADMRTDGTGLWSYALISGNYMPKRNRIWLCPTHLLNDPAVATRAATQASADSYPRSYVICGSLLGTNDTATAYKTPVSLQMISAPSQLFMLTEWHSPNSGLRWAPSGDSTQATTFEEQRVTGNPPPKSYHKNGDRHFAFADGHVKYLTLTAAANDTYWKR